MEPPTLRAFFIPSAMIEHGHTDFDYAAVDTALGEDAATKGELYEALGFALAEVFHWQTNTGHDRLVGRPDAHTIGLRTVAALWVVNPAAFGNVSLLRLSEMFDCSDSILSRYAVQFQDRFAFKGRAQRSEETRRKMRAARRPVAMPAAPRDVSSN